ncbi:hypothetical protein QX776_16275 [Alteromonadaceae bacterium BrNp21-10]|nr:hypothetical protein [Alteromonadaceae bacterium BrNp21-10]
MISLISELSVSHMKKGYNELALINNMYTYNMLLANKLTQWMDIIDNNGELEKPLNDAAFMQQITPLAKWDDVATIELVNPEFTVAEE